jgi:hypothetical protein
MTIAAGGLLRADIVVPQQTAGGVRGGIERLPISIDYF